MPYEEQSGPKFDRPIRNGLIVGIILAFLVGGGAPWWWPLLSDSPPLINETGELSRVVKSQKCEAKPYTAILRDGSVELGLYAHSFEDNTATVKVRWKDEEGKMGSPENVSLSAGVPKPLGIPEVPLLIEVSKPEEECKIGYVLTHK